MKTFDEVFNEIKSSVSVTKSGKIKKTFSYTDFNRLLKAFLNDPEYTTKVASTKDGEVVYKEVKPVEQFRGMIKRVLVDFGVDKQEAENISTSYQFTNVDGLYEVMSEIIYQYMLADKKFDFMTKERFAGSLTVKSVDKAVGTYRSIRKKGDKTPPEEFQVETDQHFVLEKKSKAPKWLKKKFKNKKK